MNTDMNEEVKQEQQVEKQEPKVSLEDILLKLSDRLDQMEKRFEVPVPPKQSDEVDEVTELKNKLSAYEKSTSELVEKARKEEAKKYSLLTKLSRMNVVDPDALLKLEPGVLELEDEKVEEFVLNELKEKRSYLFSDNTVQKNKREATAPMSAKPVLNGVSGFTKEELDLFKRFGVSEKAMALTLEQRAKLNKR